MFGDARRQPLVRGLYDAGQEHIGFVHQRLAAIGAKQRESLGIAAVVLQRDGLIHLGDFFSDDGGQPRKQRFGFRVAGKRYPQLVEVLQRQRFCAVKGREINLVSGDEEAALAGFGGPHRVAQLDRRPARVARLDHFVEIDLRALA